MGRRRAPKDNPFAPLLPKLTGLSGSPLSAVADRLRKDIEDLQATLAAGLLSSDEALAAARLHDVIVKSLPHSFGERFLFDSAMVQALVDQWSRPSCRLPTLIVPIYHTEWAHASLFPLGRDRENMDVIHLLYIEGTDDIGDVDLLSYSWMCHELAHNLLFRYDAGLIAQFHPVLNQRANALHLSALSDQGSVKTQARQLVEEVVQVWSLSGDQRNWAHELAADLIALWTCGPAYLTAFQEAAEDSGGGSAQDRSESSDLLRARLRPDRGSAELGLDRGS